MDGLAADAIVAPPDAQQHFSEKLMLLPPSYFVTDHRQSFLSVLQPRPGVTRDSLGLPASATVYACFNQLYKIDPATFDAWARLLRQQPDSVLWLLRFPAEAVDNIKAAVRARGLDASRVVFSDPTHKDAYMQRAKLANLFLDTPLVNAHTSATDVLWAGVPMVTLPGNAMISRVAASILIADGLPHFIARNLEVPPPSPPVSLPASYLHTPSPPPPSSGLRQHGCCICPGSGVGGSGWASTRSSREC
jgi:protein O-GlcNAc transferase